jgi:N-methylhydantoinase A
VLAAVGLVLERAGAEPQELERFAHGMTVATNALLEGRTARTALIATEGFTDVIELGRQARPHLYELCRSAPPPLVPHELRLAAPERIGIDGPLRSLDPGAARSVIARLAGLQPEAVAVALLHSYADPSHERLLGGLLAELLPEVHVTLSSDLVGTFREFERTATTVLDAALSPLLGSYLRRLSREARAGSLPEPQVMQSSGGLTSAGRAAKHAALTVLSGPAGGVAGAELLAQLATERDVICFDMGGTSCDVCVIEDGEVAETATREIAGRPLALPALDIHTVGAGGGSIAWRDSGGALRVGPSSAGAEPGPACYGRGGLLPTVTDANLLLGRLLPDTPLAGQIELDRGAAERAVSALGAELALDVTSCAEGIVRVAESEMLGALRLMTVERGIDPRGFALMPFGGAGALHAAALADELGITRILGPRASGVLCALGLAAAGPRRDVSRTVLLSGSSLTAARLVRESDALIEEAWEALGASPSRLRVLHELRYRGQSYELPIEVARPAGPEELREAFGRAHELRYGYRDDAEEVELVTLRVSVWGTAPALPLMASTAAEQPAARLRRIVLAGETIDVRVLRGELPPGTRLEGPALCALPEATMLIAPGWEGEVDAHGTARLSRVEGRP